MAQDTHRFDPTAIREYDIRGIVGRTLSARDAYAVGRGFGTMVKEAGGSRAAVGYDGRLSSPELEAAVVEGLRDCGLDVLRVGRGPTPMLYFAVRALGLDGGVMITGSHNPAEYNGFKMMLGKGAFYGASIRHIAEIASQGSYASGPRGKVEDRPQLEDYVQRLGVGLSRGPDADGGLGRRQWRGGRGHGAAGREAPGPPCAALRDDRRQLPQSPSRSHRAGESRGIFRPGSSRRRPISASPSTATATASAWSTAAARSSGAISSWCSTLARSWPSSPGATVIADVKASQVLFDEIKRAGGEPLMWRTGHSLIKAKMAETGAPLAGEMSGHIFFADRYFGFDDALYAAVRILNIVSQSRPEPRPDAQLPAAGDEYAGAALPLQRGAEVRRGPGDGRTPAPGRG